MHLLRINNNEKKKNELCTFCRNIKVENVSTSSQFLKLESSIVTVIKRDCPYRICTKKMFIIRWNGRGIHKYD